MIRLGHMCASMSRVDLNGAPLTELVLIATCSAVLAITYLEIVTRPNNPSSYVIRSVEAVISESTT